MSTAFSVAEVLDKLEKRIAFHREQADHHAQQEIHHREQNAHHLAELKRAKPLDGQEPLMPTDRSLQEALSLVPRSLGARRLPALGRRSSAAPR
jgi:hypothetical protein